MCNIGRIPSANRGSKKLCSCFIWKMRAIMKKVVQKEKKQSSFNYDPWSYALNFDDGGCHSRGMDAPQILQEQEQAEGRSYRKVYALTIGYYY
ncbi:hypothetical protein MA16_Dca000574 [Dendrobium catenatum]|uniref:Uncharacterized protein n=1 Tax=Dendrobium catenatum TaxID=906689 RepID=A0A2I0WU94_9ASPA|nr:hypothetical protein MA16_Dca000574 [Dendrobium catenatum]